MFVLKKDLPFAKKGTKIDKLRSSSGTDELSFIQIGQCKCQIPDKGDIFEWVEEVDSDQEVLKEFPDKYLIIVLENLLKRIKKLETQNGTDR